MYNNLLGCQCDSNFRPSIAISTNHTIAQNTQPHPNTYGIKKVKRSFFLLGNQMDLTLKSNTYYY